MTDDQAKMLEKLHDYWFTSPTAKQDVRADQFDTMVKHYNNGKFAMRALLYAGAGITAFIAWSKDLKESVLSILGG